MAQRDIARLGIVEDDPIMGESLRTRLALEGYRVEWWRSGNEAVRHLAEPDVSVNLVLCDIRLPDVNGEEVFAKVNRFHSVPFLFMSGFAEIDQAVRLMKSGAVDFITKPFDMTMLLERLKSILSAHTLGDVEAPLGPSAAMRQTQMIIKRYANHSLPVLFQGETGTGKEVCARYLHRVSPRAGQPFMAVNCAAIPSELLESELFGHEKGAFTGAHQTHRGYAERAGQGILFLDEIGDMPIQLQSKLLRLLEDGAFYRLGSEQPIPFQARIVCATHHDLTAAGQFRQDLYYRLSTLPLELPPLRQRPEDVLWLAKLFLDDFLEGQDSRVHGIGLLGEEALIAHSWPGNVRELRNRVQRAAAVCDNPWLMPHDFFPERGRSEPGLSIAETTTLSDARDVAERRQILNALSANGGHVSQTAQALGISRTTLWGKMKRLEIDGQRRGSET
jgi:DNA-binding NtrC family response regulator